MATSTNTIWSAGFSECPTGEALNARSIVEMLDRIGDEQVRPPGSPSGDPAAAPLLISRRELLARVLWTRAILDADSAATKIIIEYLDGKPGDAGANPDEKPIFNADNLARAEALLLEELSNDYPTLS